MYSQKPLNASAPESPYSHIKGAKITYVTHGAAPHPQLYQRSMNSTACMLSSRTYASSTPVLAWATKNTLQPPGCIASSTLWPQPRRQSSSLPCQRKAGLSLLRFMCHCTWSAVYTWCTWCTGRMQQDPAATLAARNPQTRQAMKLDWFLHKSSTRECRTQSHICTSYVCMTSDTQNPHNPNYASQSSRLATIKALSASFVYMRQQGGLLTSEHAGSQSPLGCQQADCKP